MDTCDPFTRIIILLTLVTACAEFGLRLSTLQPRLRTCPWREWPRLLWQTILDDRIYLMGPFSRLTDSRRRRHNDPPDDPPARPE